MLVTGEYLGVPLSQLIAAFVYRSADTVESSETEEITFRTQKIDVASVSASLTKLTIAGAEADPEKVFLTSPSEVLTVEQAVYLYFIHVDAALDATYETYASLVSKYEEAAPDDYILDFLTSRNQLLSATLGICWSYGIVGTFFTSATPHRERFFLLVLADRIRHLRYKAPHPGSAEERKTQLRERNSYIRAAQRQIRTLLYQPSGTSSTVMQKRALLHRSAQVRSTEAGFIGSSLRSASDTVQQAQIMELVETARRELTPEEAAVVLEVRELLEDQFGEVAREACAEEPRMMDMSLKDFRETYGFYGLNSGGTVILPASLSRAQLKNVLEHEYRHNLLSLIRRGYGYGLNEALIEGSTEHPDAYNVERYFLRQLLRLLHLAVPEKKISQVYSSEQELTIYELLFLAAHHGACTRSDSEEQLLFDAALLYTFGIEGMQIAYFTKSSGLLVPEAVSRNLFPPMQSVQLLSSYFSARSCKKLSSADIHSSADKAYYFEQELARAVDDPHLAQLALLGSKDATIEKLPAEYVDVLLQQQIFLLKYDTLLKSWGEAPMGKQPAADTCRQVIGQLMSLRAHSTVGYWVDPDFWRVEELEPEEFYYAWVEWMRNETEKQKRMTCEVPNVTES